MPERGRPLLKACAIRKDVLEAKAGISTLAVDFDAILSEGSQTAYDDPSDFFRMTYPTQALVTIATRVFQRITGQRPEVAGIYLLGTALGGGKSHLLASLYHMAQSGSQVLPEEFQKDIEAIPDPIFDRLSPQVRHACSEMHVEVLPYSLLLPVISILRRQNQFTETSLQRVFTSLTRIRASLDRIANKMESGIKRPVKTMGNSIQEIGTELTAIKTEMNLLQEGASD